MNAREDSLKRRRTDKDLQDQLCEDPDDASLIDQIAERAADRAIEKMTAKIYTEVGRSVVTKFIWLAGAITTALYFWAKSKGWME